MILVIDEITNLSPTDTVLAYGLRANWFDLPARLAEVGPQQAFNELYRSGGGIGWDLITPLQQVPDTAPIHVEPPSTIAARARVPSPRSTVEALWPPAVFDPEWGTLPAYKMGGMQWPASFGPDSLFPAPLCVMIVRADGSLLLTVIQLLTYQAIGPGTPNPGDIQIDAAHVISGIGMTQDPGGQPLTHALRLTSWPLPAAVDSEVIFDFVRQAAGPVDPRWAQPTGWPEPAAQTILLADLSTLRFIPDDSPWCPSSPMVHVGLAVSETVLLRRGRTQDFSGAELTYELDNKSICWQSVTRIMARLFLLALLFATIGSRGYRLLMAFDETGQLPAPPDPDG